MFFRCWVAIHRFASAKASSSSLEQKVDDLFSSHYTLLQLNILSSHTSRRVEKMEFWFKIIQIVPSSIVIACDGLHCISEFLHNLHLIFLLVMPQLNSYSNHPIRCSFIQSRSFQRKKIYICQNLRLQYIIIQAYSRANYVPGSLARRYAMVTSRPEEYRRFYQGKISHGDYAWNSSWIIASVTLASSHEDRFSFLMEP